MELRNQPCMKRVCNQNQERTKVVSIVRVCDPNEDFRDCERVGARISKLQGSVCVCVYYVMFYFGVMRFSLWSLKYEKFTNIFHNHIN